MNDTSATAAPPVDDIFATKNPDLLPGLRFGWSRKAKPLRGAHARLRFGLFAYAAVMTFNLIIVAVMMYLFFTFQDPLLPAEPSAMVVLLASILAVGGTYLPFALIGVTLICIILYLLFVYRGMKNLHLSNARGLSVSPGWAVGWSFIPLANLGMIPGVMRQIWTASHDPSRGAASPPFLTIVWWATWLGSGVTGRISDALTPRDTTMELLASEELFDAFVPASILTVVSSSLAIVSTLCLMVIIKQITTAQDLLEKASTFDE